MKDKRLIAKLLDKKDYFPFFVSLVLILFVPITTFTILFAHFFSDAYTQKLISLAEATCIRTQTYFEQTIAQCEQLAYMLEDDPLFQLENPGEIPRAWMPIVAQLNQSRELNDALVEIVYQRTDSNVLFTSARAVYEPRGSVDGIHRLEEIPAKTGFLRPAFLGSGPSTTKAVIACTVPILDGEGALSFWLDAEQLLPTPVDADPRFSLMLWDNGMVIWQRGLAGSAALADFAALEGNFELYHTAAGSYYSNRLGAERTSAQVYYILPYEMVMGDSDNMTRTFTLGILIEASICIALIAFLIRRSYQPVHQLYGSVLKFAPELLPPVAAGEIEAANYALQRLSNREYLLKQQQQQAVQQKLLHRLFTGSLRDESTLESAGIHLAGRRCAVVLFSLRKDFPDEAFAAPLSELRILLEELNVPSYSTDYIENRSQLFLLVLDGRSLEEIVGQAARSIERKMGRIFYFGCGGIAEQTSDIWRSYCEAMSAPELQEGEQTVYIYNCPPPPRTVFQICIHRQNWMAFIMR